MLLKIQIGPVILSCIVFLLVFLYCFIKIVRAFKKGYISYGGNSPSTSTIRKYSKQDQPLMFWAGIVVFSLPVIILAILALAFAGVI